MDGSTMREMAWLTQQGRRDSNPQPPVLETGALPIELRPWAAEDCIGAFRAFREAMTDLPMEDMDRTQREREADMDEILNEEQEATSHGDDEGEREGALPE